MRCIFILALLLCSVAHAALGPENLLLIVNKNLPESQPLAEYYAQQRKVPAGRILSLDLPVGDEINIDAFDQQLIAPVRAFLTASHLEQQVTCLVTFYGVPLRIQNRVNSPELRAEIVSLRQQLKAAITQSQAIAESLEKLAIEADPTFKPFPNGADVAETLPRRAERAAGVVIAKAQQLPEGEKRKSIEEKLKKISDDVRAVVTIPEPATAPTAATSRPAIAMTPQEYTAKVAEMAQKRWDPADRRALRDLVRAHGGLIGFMQIVAAQEQFLTPDESEAAVDNELALVWWGLYSRYRWQANPLSFKHPELRGKPMVMVARLDGGSPDQVRSIIDTSIKVEREGLKGRVVLDSRGIMPKNINGRSDVFGVYDQMIRDLGALLRAKTKLQLLVDDKPNLLEPGSAKDCAIYCGWYSAGKYVPSVSLVPGGVAYHIASYEMTALHGVTTGWCRNLLDTGAVATLGPVSEPYLHAFPPPDDFFPLLLTGQLPLAEVFWATNPLVSWKIALVGDPLYTPFKTNPAIRIDDLPAPMRGIFAAPAAPVAPLPKAQ